MPEYAESFILSHLAYSLVQIRSRILITCTRASCVLVKSFLSPLLRQREGDQGGRAGLCSHRISGQKHDPFTPPPLTPPPADARGGGCPHLNAQRSRVFGPSSSSRRRPGSMRYR